MFSEVFHLLAIVKKVLAYMRTNIINGMMNMSRSETEA